MNTLANAFQAAREADLPSIWASYQLPMRISNGRVQSAYSPCCGKADRPDATSLFRAKSGTWRYHCFRCGKGGTAIDLVSKMDGLSDRDAAVKIAGSSYEAAKPTSSSSRGIVNGGRSSGSSEAIAEVVRRLRCAVGGRVEPKISAYLQGRGISEGRIRTVTEAGLMLHLPSDPSQAEALVRTHCGEELLMAAGMLKGKWTALAFRPLAFIPEDSGSIEFRVIDKHAKPPKALQYGDAKVPLVLRARNTKYIAIVEGGVDMLSVAELGEAKAETTVVGLWGASKWRPQWWASLHQEFPQAVFLLSTDGDKAGEDAAVAIAASLPDGSRYKRLAPHYGLDDWNDVLLHRRQA